MYKIRGLVWFPTIDKNTDMIVEMRIIYSLRIGRHTKEDHDWIHKCSGVGIVPQRPHHKIRRIQLGHPGQRLFHDEFDNTIYAGHQ